MPVANIQDFRGLSEYKLTTPSGGKVIITPEEEAEIAKDALRWKLHAELIAGDKAKETVINAVIGAIGTAVGLAIGGLALTKILGMGGK